MFSVRHSALPVSPGCSVGATWLQSVTVKGEVGSFIAMILAFSRGYKPYALSTYSVIASAAKQSRKSLRGNSLDCFAALAMTAEASMRQMVRRALHDQPGRIHPQVLADPLAPLILII